MEQVPEMSAAKQSEQNILYIIVDVMILLKNLIFLLYSRYIIITCSLLKKHSSNPLIEIWSTVSK